MITALAVSIALIVAFPLGFTLGVLVAKRAFEELCRK